MILNLFRVYRKIPHQYLRAKYDTVEDTEYTMEETIDIIFNAIEDLVVMGELAGRLYSVQQVVNLG